ncbi:glycosyltransferase [Modestobacter sp. SYSU DS0875]
MPDPSSPGFVVQQSFPTPRPTTNPYIVMLGRSLAALEDVELRTFSWRRALLRRYDVFHVHWPEILVAGQSPLKALVRQLLFLLLLARLRLTRTPLVRTVHNLELPQGISRREVALLRLAERLTTLRIRLNESTEVAPGRPAELIVHGHYRDWFARFPQAATVPGRITFFGLVRRYKGVERLIEVVTATPGDRVEGDLSLHVAGRPSSDELADRLRRTAATDPRVHLRLEFLDDADLVAEVTAAELVVLPYREMHNSGGALTALSLARPVLVPANDVTRALAAEVGPGWVWTYDGDLESADLVGALRGVRTRGEVPAPDLSARDWDVAGRAHLAAYRRAVALARS